jgi:hypothetical protein
VEPARIARREQIHAALARATLKDLGKLAITVRCLRSYAMPHLVECGGTDEDAGQEPGQVISARPRGRMRVLLPPEIRSTRAQPGTAERAIIDGRRDGGH